MKLMLRQTDMERKRERDEHNQAAGYKAGWLGCWLALLQPRFHPFLISAAAVGALLAAAF